MRLICLPYAGGGTAAYRPWSELLPYDIDLCLVKLPGREMRMQEEPYDNLDSLIDELVLALGPLLDRPVAIFGHSMGALIALELARRLRSRGCPEPEYLLVSGRRAPQIPDPDPPLHKLPDAAFVAALVRRYNGIPPVLLQNADLLRLFLPTLRADLAMIETFRFIDESPLDTPIAVFGGWNDGRATQSHLAAWRELTRGPFALQMFPGDHFFIQTVRDELVASIVELLAPVIRSVSADQHRQAQQQDSSVTVIPRSI
jgi:medium-chain acyl-[acyl-carrier-protein] hydrolase